MDVRNGGSPRMIFDIRACQQPSSSWCTGKRQIGFQALIQDLTVTSTCFILCQRNCSTSTSNLLCPVWNKGSGLRAVLRPDSSFRLISPHSSAIKQQCHPQPLSRQHRTTMHSPVRITRLITPRWHRPVGSFRPRRLSLSDGSLWHSLGSDIGWRKMKLLEWVLRRDIVSSAIEVHLSSADGRSYWTMYPGRHDQLPSPSSRGSTPPRPIRMDIAKCKRTRRDHFANHEA